jgi:tetratricopeptide (TPR) repeat protein
MASRHQARVEARSASHPRSTSVSAHASPERSISDALVELLARAQRTLDEDCAAEVVDELEASLESLSLTSAATWAVLGAAFDRLGRYEQRDRAYTTAVEAFDRATSRPAQAVATALAGALAAVKRAGDAIELLRSAAKQDPGDPSVARLLAEQLEAVGDLAGASKAYSALAQVVTPDESVKILRHAVELDPGDLDLRAELGRALLRTREWDMATETLRAVIDRLPLSHPGRSWLAEAYRQSGNLDAALATTLVVLEAHPDDSLALRVRAACHADRRELDLALTDLRRVLESHPDDDAARGELVYLLDRSGRTSEALAEAQLLANSRPDDPTALATLGEILQASDGVEAIRVLDRALALAPEDLDIRFRRAEVLRRLGRLDEARAELEALLDARPDDPLVVGTHGQVLAAEGKSEEALVALDRALELSRGLAWVLESKATVEFVLGRRTDGLATLDRLLELQPDNVGAHLEKGEQLLRLDDPHGALEAAQAVIAAEPELGQAHVLLGEALIGLDRAEDALGAFGVALAHTDSVTDVAEVYAWRGRAQQRLLQWSAACEDFDAALELRPRDRAFLFDRGRCRYALGQLEVAAQDLREAAEASEREGDQVYQADCLALLGEIQRSLGELDVARETLDRTLGLNPTNPTLAFALGTKGEVLASQGETSDALEALRAALAIEPALSWARASLAEQLRMRGEYDEALAELDRIIALGDESAFVRGTRGQVLIGLGRGGDGMDDLLAAWALEPAPWIAYALASALLALNSLKHVDTTLEILDQALAATPEARALLPMKAEVLRFAQRASEALATIELYLAGNENDDDSLATKAHILVDLRRDREASVIAGEVVARNPAHRFARLALVRSLIKLDEYVEALREVELLLDLDSNDTSTQVMKAELLSRLGRFDAAVAAATAALERDPDDPDAHGVAGEAMLQLSPPENERAVEHLRKAATSNPDYVFWQVELADALARIGREEEARLLRERVAEQVKTGKLTDPYELAQAGWAAMRLGNFDDAIAWHREGLAIDPSMIDTRFALGLILLQAGRGELAIDEYEGAASLVEKRTDTERGKELVAEALRELRPVRDEGLLDSVRESAAAVEATLERVLARLNEREHNAHLA